jgi:hypothetical protein
MKRASGPRKTANKSRYLVINRNIALNAAGRGCNRGSRYPWAIDSLLRSH